MFSILMLLALVSRPVADYEDIKTIVMGANSAILPVAQQIIPELSDDVELIFIADTEEELLAFKNRLDPNIPAQVRFLALDFKLPSNLWLRDYLPKPLFSPNDVSRSAIGIRYQRNYSNLHMGVFYAEFGMETELRIDYLPEDFEFGNLLADIEGNCFLIGAASRGIDGQILRSKELSDEILSDEVGCKSVSKLKWDFIGIGHIDEVMILTAARKALVTTRSAGETLKDLGYTVEHLPHLNLKGESYTNALIVNDMVFVPQFARKEDQEALAIYRGHFNKVVPVRIPDEITSLGGGLHCLTATYHHDFPVSD